MLGSTLQYRSIGPRCVLLTAHLRRHIITSNSSMCCVSFSFKTCMPSKERPLSCHKARGESVGTLQTLKLSVPESITAFQRFPSSISRCCSSVFVTSRYSFSTNASKQPDEDNNPPEQKLTLFQKFKQMYRDYWYVLVPVHIVTSLGWFAGFYYLVKSGVDVIALLESMGLSDKLINPLRDSGAGYIALAYALYKIATPVRYTVTLGGTTISIKYLKEWGYIKPIPPREKLREIYQEKKELYQEELKMKQERLKKTRDTMLRGYRDRADSKDEK